MEPELTIKRTFDAPRELVFKAWTDPALVAKWWGPDLFSTPIAEVEGRKGGTLYIVMRGPKGSEFDIDMPMRGVFTEFDPPRKLVFTNEALFDDNGVAQLAAVCTATFEEAGSQTHMTLQIVPTKVTEVAKAAWGGAEMGWNQSLDRLTALVNGYQTEAVKKTPLSAR